MEWSLFLGVILAFALIHLDKKEFRFVNFFIEVMVLGVIFTMVRLGRKLFLTEIDFPLSIDEYIHEVIHIWGGGLFIFLVVYVFCYKVWHTTNS